MFNKTTEDDFTNIIGSFIWPVYFGEYKKKMIDNYSTISVDIAKSIFSHNIYTDYYNGNFNNTVWNIDFNTEPCVYFSLLVDSLQVWDRKKYANAKIDYSIFFEADSYNIEIKNKKLIISFRCESNHSKRLYKKFKESLGSYLSNSASLLDISFEEI